MSVEGVSRELLSKSEKKAQRDVVNDIATELFEEFIASETKEDDKFQTIRKNLEYLKLDVNDVEALRKYKEIILDKY